MQVIGTNEIRGLDVSRSIGEHSLRLGAVCSVKSVIITLFITSGNKKIIIINQLKKIKKKNPFIDFYNIFFMFFVSFC